MADVEVVISGIGANFAGSSNLKELSRNLFANKTVTGPTGRWKYGKLGGGGHKAGRPGSSLAALQQFENIKAVKSMVSTT